MICLDKISKVFSRKQAHEDVVALSDVSLTLPDNGFISILGASGSGKTTLLNIIGGLDHPTSGNMIVDNLSTSEFKSKDWDAYRNEKIGFVLQNYYLLPHLSIKDNIAIKLQLSTKYSKDDISKLVDEALEKVNLYDRRNDMPKTLSGGQKQRVAIARAIVGQPVVILADEPTGALDSKAGGQIMEILKELSKNHLVVMVTHNQEYAKKYSDRIIELKDGVIVHDSAPQSEIKSDKENSLGKVKFPWLTSLKWGLKNLFLKKLSTLSIVLASALGLAGVGLILSISSGVSDAFLQAEENALSQYPVYFSSNASYSSDGSAPHYTEYTDEQEIYVDVADRSVRDHLNFMSNRFLDYMDKMPEDYYSVRYESCATNFNIYTKVNDTEYKKVNTTSSYFSKGVNQEDFIEEQYDCLKGKYPTEENEIAIVVDTYNRISGYTLESLGFDLDSSVYQEKAFTFDEVLSKTYRYVTNDQYYRYDDMSETFKVRNYTPQEFYELSTYELKVVGILREKVDASSAFYRNGMVYTHAFEKKVLKDANESAIVKKQLELGLTGNVVTGAPITDIEYDTLIYKADYVYETLMFQLGQYEEVVVIYYFTKTIDARNKLVDYFEAYVPDPTKDYGRLSYNDYLERVSVQFDGTLKMMVSVLYVFAAISVLVSAILNGILTYISVHQRTGEVGLLRSLGSRKKDIAFMIETESLLSGLFGGLLAIGFAALLTEPLNQFLKAAIYANNVYLLSKTTFTLPPFQLWVAPILIGIAVVTALISAFIPAIIAARKDPARAINE